MKQYTIASLNDEAAQGKNHETNQSPVIFAGTPQVAADCLSGLLEAGLNIVAVLTRPDAPVGRKRTLTPSPVAQIAESHGIDVIKASRVTAEITEVLASKNATLGIVVAYGALLPQNALDVPSQGWVNLHYSQLPLYRGAAPVQHAVLDGVESTAATIFKLEKGMDTGPIFAAVSYPLPLGITSGEALAELTGAGTQLLLQIFNDVSTGTLLPTPQRGEPSFAPKLDAQDAFVSSHASARQIIQRINATIPEPGAWTSKGSERMKLGQAQLSELAPDQTADRLVGEVFLHPTMPKNKAAVLLKAEDGYNVQLSTVQPAGKKEIPALDWFRGLQERTILGAPSPSLETSES